jgi:hypothetical protein
VCQGVGSFFLLAAFRVDLVVLLLCNNKPINHWPFWKQATAQPPVSPEVTDGGAKKQVSLLRGLWSPNSVES